MQITHIEWIVPQLQTLSISSMQLSQILENKKAELDNLPEVVRLRGEIRELEKLYSENESHINSLKEQGKEMLLSNWLKEFTALNGTTVALQFTPWALVVEDSSNIPDKFWKVKETRDIDKKALKSAIESGEFYDDKVYIQKDCKLLIKQK